MENRRHIKTNLIIGGALLSVFLFALSAFGYSQNTTHPALTDEIVDFYNLNFSDKTLTYQEKQWLIQGSVEEDVGARPLYHFYDPVYDRGLAMVAGISSKDWGLKANLQANILGRQYAGFISVLNNETGFDFSYQRALEDYAKGDKERAFKSFGHILHLLEDAGVPDHTRDDPHPPVLDFGSPYEHEMDKWNPDNFNISKNLFLAREKPVDLYSMDKYFDRVANYSNNNFFSRDTISNEKYNKPLTTNINRIFINGKLSLFIFNKDKQGTDFPIALVVTDSTNKSIKDITLYNEAIGSYILDGYWERLSKEVVISGAGALRLFLEEAEKEKQEYLTKETTKNSNFWAQVVSLLGFREKNEGELATYTTTSDVVVNSDVDLLPVVTNNGDTGDTSGDSNVSLPLSPTLSPSLSPNTTESKTKSTVPPSPTPTPILLPTLTPKLSESKNSGIVIINEVAWAGTEASATDEWIELYNTENYDINLSGWVLIADDGAPEIIFEEGKIIKANSYFLLERTNDLTVNSFPADQIYTGALGNEGEVLRLINTSGTLIDSAGKTNKAWPAGNSTGKISMERTPDDNWKNFSGNPSAKDANGNFINGTPKSPNSLVIFVVTGISGGGGGSSSQTTPSLSPIPTPSPEPIVSPTPTPTSSPEPTPSPSPAEKININTADLEKLQEITGVGPVIAQRIIDYREANGQFQKIEDIKSVSGIGDAKFEVMKDEITVGNIVFNPSAVADLVAGHHSPIITATWSAPDPGSFVPASLSYDLRYSVISFPDANTWDTAIKIASSSLPVVGGKGASESASFDVVYEYGQTLYFALKTKLKSCEENCYESTISNIAEVSFPNAIDDNSWAMFGKNQHHTSFANVIGPGVGATISWEFNDSLEGIIKQPVVSVDGDVYFGVASDLSKKIIKLNKNGVKQWEYDTNVSIGMPTILSDGTVYFGRIGAGGVLAFTALNSNGSKKWDYDESSKVEYITVSSKGEPHFTFQSGNQEKLLVLKTNGSVGTTIVSSGLGGFVPVILNNGDIIVASKISGNQLFTAYSADGSQLWQLFHTKANGSTPMDLSYDDSTGIIYSAAGSKLFNIPVDGSILNFQSIETGHVAATTVAISTDTLYVGFNNVNLSSGSRVFALNKSDLSTKWYFQADGLLNNQIVIDKDQNIYFSTQNGKLYSIDAVGTLRWTIKTALKSTISPVLVENGLVWAYEDQIVLIK